MPRPKGQDTFRLGACKRALAAVSKEEAVDMYFQTTFSKSYLGRKVPPETLENFLDVHFLGQRPSKYMQYQQKTAPLLARDSCNYTRDYVEMPLGDAPITKSLAKNFKERGRMSRGANTAAKFDGESKYTSDFQPPTREQARAARPESAKPKAQRTSTLPSGKLLEVQSLTHTNFGFPYRLTPTDKAVPPQPNLFVSTVRLAAPRTCYQEAYATPKTRTLRRCSSAPSGGRRDPVPSTPTSVLESLAPEAPVQRLAKETQHTKADRPQSAVSRPRPSDSEVGSEKRRRPASAAQLRG